MTSTITAPNAATVFSTPDRLDGLKELRTGWDAIRLAAQAPSLLRAPRGNGRAVVVIPGLKANDTALLPLRRYLTQLGHEARPWGLGVNSGDLELLLERTQQTISQVAEETGQAVNVVGWSLGGVYARETARDRPELVHRVATFGTPLLGPRYTLGQRFYSDAELERIEAMIDERSRRSIDRPLTAIYSKNDGIVDWRTCRDPHTPGAVNIEVTSSHLGMGLDPTVWRHLAHWLAEPNAPCSS